MNRVGRGSVVRVMAAVAWTFAALIGTAQAALAADGQTPVAVLPDAKAATVLGESIVAEATAAAGVPDATAALEPAVPAPPTAQTPAPAVSAEQYQPEPPQYHEESGQYHEPVPDPAAPATALAPPVLGGGPVNVNVGVRVLSPGDDGDVIQSVTSIGSTPPVSAPATPAVTPAAAVASVAVSIVVNVTVTTINIHQTIVNDIRYHDPVPQYHVASRTGVPIAAPTSSSTAPAANQRELPAAPAARPSRSKEQPVAPSRRGTAEVAVEAASRAGLSTGAFGVSHAAFTAPRLWESASRSERRTPERSRTRQLRPRLTAPTVPTVPRSPERLAGASATGGGLVGGLLKTFAVLVAALGLVALPPARRLRLPSPRLQEADGQRPEDPG